MDSKFSRTSVTVDEAVAILLGVMNGPVSFQAMSDEVSNEEQDVLDSLTYDLRAELRDEITALISDRAEAILAKKPQDVIDAIETELKRYRELDDLAFAYRCAIEDELGNGEASALRRDAARSNAQDTYITLSSLDAWAVEKGCRESILTPVPKVTSSNATETECQKKALRVRRRHRDQEEAIVAKIKQLGYTPLELPKNDPGKPGVKAQVRDVLQASNLFGTSKIFDHAWERLRKGKEIIDKKE